MRDGKVVIVLLQSTAQRHDHVVSVLSILILYFVLLLYPLLHHYFAGQSSNQKWAVCRNVGDRVELSRQA